MELLLFLFSLRVLFCLQVDAKLSAALKRQALVEAQLKEVHPNDVNGMVHATQRLCAIPDCTHLIGSSAGGPCTHCKLILCPQHRPPHTGHKCDLAPPLKEKKKKANKQENKSVEMACGEDYEDRQAELKRRMRETLYGFSERRRR